MDDRSQPTLFEYQIEILPPEGDLTVEGTACLCCNVQRPARCMDEDGFGICDECLLP